MSFRPGAIGVVFAGRIDDGGFMQSGFEALELARERLAVRITYRDGISPDPKQLARALRSLAYEGNALVIAHGGQNDPAALQVCAEFPHTQFAVTQGSVCGPNLSSFEVRQEQSAFLAGVAAARLTKTGVVGHISGIRVRPGLLGRAAFAAGVHAQDPAVELLTTFCGTQEDETLARAVAEQQAERGADVIFTMLNSAISGVIALCKARGIYQIGNVRDWVSVDPGVFAASAIADVGRGVYESCRMYAEGCWEFGRTIRIGLERPEAVRLVLNPAIAAQVTDCVMAWSAKLCGQQWHIPASYEGAEFSP
jgi:basic membrane protein A